MPQPHYRLNDRYELQTKLGQDASRQTWVATDLGSLSHPRVIVKLLALSPQMQWDESKLFEREGQILQRLDHPRIPKYHDYFVLDSLPDSRFPWFCLVQSCIPGMSLQQLLDEGRRFTAAEVEKVAIEILSILVYLHGLEPPVLHRDIKPSNLIWGEDDRLYLVDFGAVQDQAVAAGATFTVVGTYGYVPMEQFGGRAVPASDLYALGATLIHLLTGTAPADLPQRDARIQFADQVGVDLGFVNWIGKLTEPQVSERLSSAQEAIVALEQRHAITPPITNRKPRGSRIQLHKSANQLEIKIPRRGWRSIRGIYVLTIFLSTLGMLFWWGWFAVILLPGAVGTLFAIAFDQTYIRLDRDRDRFEVRREIFGICTKRSLGKIANITRISETEVKHAGEVRGVAIETGHYGKQFSTNPLATVERKWLIEELNDWLQLEPESHPEPQLAEDLRQEWFDDNPDNRRDREP